MLGDFRPQARLMIERSGTAGGATGLLRSKHLAMEA